MTIMKIYIFIIVMCIAAMSKAQDIGHATFYGTKFNNRKTASGEIYRKDSMVCAHKTYPFGTLLKVKNIDNDKEVIVRVIDRGPFRKRYIIDLSHAAAKELDMVRKGVSKVAISEHNIELQPILFTDTVFSLK